MLLCHFLAGSSSSPAHLRVYLTRWKFWTERQGALRMLWTLSVPEVNSDCVAQGRHWLLTTICFGLGPESACFCQWASSLDVYECKARATQFQTMPALPKVTHLRAEPAFLSLQYEYPNSIILSQTRLFCGAQVRDGRRRAK